MTIKIRTLVLVIFLGLSTHSVAQDPVFDVHPSTQNPSLAVDFAQIKTWENELSNWGRWGSDDQRGTLNLITREKTREAARLVRDGVTVPLARFVSEEVAMDSQRWVPTKHWMTMVDPTTGAVSAAMDAVSFGLHDGLLSHIDALCHYAADRNGKRVIFNGYPQALDHDGCKDLAVERMGSGYVTRGILVDMPLLKGVEWLEPGTPIYVSDLIEWEEYAGVKIDSGDALLIRGGRWAKRAKDGPWAYNRGGVGLHASVVPWLRERDIGLLVSDAVNDVQPSGVEGVNRPVHHLSIVFLGLPLVDNGYLEDVAREAAARHRWEFMVSWHITQVPGGTASPFNAIATF